MDAVRDAVGPLMSVGFLLLLILLRLDAERFGAAEYDETNRDGRPTSLRRRLAWYLLGFGLIAAVGVVHPTAGTDLFLTLGDRFEVVAYGFSYGFVGVAQAIAFALLRYHHLRLPAVRSYPASILNTIATAFIDEATFRGMLLGFILLTGVDATSANIVQALTYALATRVAAPGRDRFMLVLVLLLGLGSGWVTIATGGLGAAFIGHAITRLAIFLATGHAGQVALRGRESEDVERRLRTPDGWYVVGARESSGPDR
jgi:hypothetical protein